MFRLIRFVFWLAAVGALIYFAATVPLGERTLVGHVRAIASSREARDLAEGTRKEAEKVKDRVKQDLQDDGTPQPTRGRGVEHLDDHDRRELDKVVRDRAAK